MKLRILFAILFFVLTTSGFAAEPDTLSFYHLSDIHLVFQLETFQKDLAKNRASCVKGLAPFRDFIKYNNKEKDADFLVVSGDLVDIYKGETENGGMFGEQIESFTHLLKKSKKPVYTILGNHDITEYSWDTARVSSQIEAGSARAEWIRNLSCFENGTYYSRIFKVGETTYRFIFLDNALNRFEGKTETDIPYIDKAQQSWLKNQFDASANDVEIVIMHIPLRKESCDVPENSIYSVLGIQSTLKLVLAGHNHKNRITKFGEDMSSFFQVQTAGFGSNPDAWRKIRLTENEILISEPGTLENELKIQIK